jgi:hypothetical protein
MIPLQDIHKPLKEIESFDAQGLKQVKVKAGLWIYVEKHLSKTQVEKRIQKYLNRAAQCERDYINRNGGRPKDTL